MISDLIKAPSVASFGTQVLQSILLVPSLFRSYIRQKSTPVNTWRCRILKLNFNSMCSNFPVERIFYNFKAVEQTYFDSQVRKFFWFDWWETGVLDCSYQTVSLQSLAEGLILRKRPNAPTQVTILKPSNKKRILVFVKVLRWLLNAFACTLKKYH